MASNDPGTANWPFQITGFAQSSMIDQNGDVVPAITVRYTSPQLGSFSEQFPKSTFNQADAINTIQQQVNELAATMFTVNNVVHPQQSSSGG